MDHLFTPHLLNIQPPSDPADTWKFLLTAAVTVLTTYFLNKIEESRAKRKEKKAEKSKINKLEAVLSKNNEIQRGIKELLIQIQGYSECSRASLLSYHNGTKTHYEYSMNFVSMVEEKTDGIVAPLLDTIQRVPAAMFRPVIDRVEEAEEGHLVVRKEDMDEEGRLLMDRYQNSVCYYFKVGNSVWEGVVELAWVNKKMTLSDEEVNHIQNLVNNISNLQRSLVKP